MVRSINIGKTDQLVWGMLKEVLQQIRDLPTISSEPVDLEQERFDDRDETLTDGIFWLSPDQIDILSDNEKKEVVRQMIDNISVSYDRGSNMHRIDVTFSETVARLLAGSVGQQRGSTDEQEPQEDGSEVVWGTGKNYGGGMWDKKSQRAAEPPLLPIMLTQ